jgi:hypothetical protein
MMRGVYVKVRRATNGIDALAILVRSMMVFESWTEDLALMEYNWWCLI